MGIRYDLKFAIIRSGRTQYEIASDLGISDSRLSRMVQGRELPDADLRRRLAKLLGVPEGELFDATAAERNTRSDVR